MATPDPFASFRVEEGQQEVPVETKGVDFIPSHQTEGAAVAPEEQIDPFVRYRVGGGPELRLPRPDNTFKEEFLARLGSGTNSMQGSLFGVVGMAGRELGIGWMEDIGNEGAQKNFQEGAAVSQGTQSFLDIEDPGDFFKWTVGALGEAIPSLATAFTGVGIGAAVGKKAVENGVRRAVARHIERDLRKKGFNTVEAIDAVRGLMTTSAGQRTVNQSMRAAVRGGLISKGQKQGSTAGLIAISSLPQIGQIDQELVSAGITDPGLTALLGGVIGGALEAAPMLKFMDLAFPGVERQVAKAFVKDFAIATGTQVALEGPTEAAQEMIQLAAMAYHDPTFDMFSPDARNRVIEAFAAGALVGGVMGGAGSIIGQSTTAARQVEKPTLPRYSFDDIKKAVEGRLDKPAQPGAAPAAPGTDPELATNSVFQEVRDRVFGAVQPRIDAIMNQMRDGTQAIIDRMDSHMDGGVNAETASFSELVKAAHNDFIETHKRELDAAKTFLEKQSKWIFEQAQTITDPQARAKFIDEKATEAQEKLSGWLEKLRQAAQQKEQSTKAEIDNMDFPDHVLAELTEQNEREAAAAENLDDDTQDSPERVVDLGEPGDVAPPPTAVFGKGQKKGTVGVDGQTTVEGFHDTERLSGREMAEKGLATLKRELPDATDEDFSIVKQDDGTYVIEVHNNELNEQMRVNEKFRRSARPTTKDPKRVFQADKGTGEDLGFSRPRLDVITMARQGQDFDPNAKTMADGLRATVAEYLVQGFINVKTANDIIEFFEKNHGAIAETSASDFAPVGSFFTEGVAQTEMIGFQEKLRDQGIQVPRKMLGVRENEDGTWGYGIQNTNLYKAWRAKDQQATIDFNAAMQAQRRQDSLAQESADAREFGGNETTQGAPPAPKQQGDLFDPDTSRSSGDVQIKGVTRETDDGKRRDIDAGDRGATAGTARTRVSSRLESNTLPTRDDDKQFARDEDGNLIQVSEETLNAPGSNRGVGVAEDTDPQADDITTNPENLPSERDTVQQTHDDITQRRTRRANANARNLSKHDQSLLRRWGRKGAFRMFTALGMSTEVQAVINSVGHFVTKTLGLTNQITFVDDHGLQLLIDQGLVTDPVFQQTLSDPSVDARNIRIGDQSFVYLSQKILSDPAATLLAFSHEMGHHLYRVAWDKLTPEGQQRLRDAFGKGTDAEFNEWMADQLAAWIARPIRAGGDVGQFFFQKVAQNIRRLYDFVKNNKRFQLDETFKSFADAVASKAKQSTVNKSNPLAQQAVDAWFQNEGTTMYQWFGDLLEQKNGIPQGAKTTPRSAEVDNMEQAVFDFKPTTEAGKQALERVTNKYPAVAKRAVTLRNWIFNAYKVALAPSTGVIRDIGKRIASANAFVTIFNRENHGVGKKGKNYHQRVYLMKGQFLEARFGSVMAKVEAEIRSERPKVSTKEMNTLRNERLRQIAKDLQSKEGNENAQFTPIEQEIRALFDDMHAYAKDAGIPVKKILNYFPRQLDQQRLINDKEKILKHLEDGGKISLSKAREIYNALVSHEAQDGRATYDATETPGFKHMNSRRGGLDPFFDQYLDTNLEGIMSNYVNAVVKRSEFNRALGEPFPADTNITAKQAIKSGLWDPKAKMHKLLKDARNKDGATEAEIRLMEQYIDANLGQLGRDAFKPGVRKFMAGIIAYQNLRVLLFTVFASLPDLAGPTIRGNFRSQWKVLRNNMHDLASNDSDIAKMARAYGSISSAANEHVMTEYVDNHYMSPKLRKMNDTFFKWTGLNWYTDFTRKMSMATGIEYISEMAETAENGQDSKSRAKAEAALAELGIAKEDVVAWEAAGRPTFLSHTNDSHTLVAEALVQFVDESIMRPNASQRPIMASHPGAMLVYHLKNYLYAVHDIILKRIKFNIDESESPAQYAAAIAPAVGMLVLTAVGLELRELIQYAGSNRKPPTDRMDGWEYTWELMQRSGLTGITQLGIDFEGAEDRGMSHVAGIGGPALSQVGDFLSKPASQTIPKAIPVIGQIPAARNAVRTVL